ncbi:histone H2A/H2B/H3/H4-like centromeric protein [Hamiltosporidium tvaerminnensis]|uniref:Histone H2A/H2B/H3/H4-like centromeric protein n=2 Tax=Hamiltosporidium TaxID=1176354 RepID=A0A4Q9L9T3_9MICR|nr:hypothetical protein LUQ84_002734 [Hamiltosporidium tvaerminnensis]TBU04478.1 histone H2A/H2B/H3/H4-like centromeric protein [Hamiltosporidium magnivora]TBU04082.1 histone H2A/H2B/H3/H4-like centromeric protein [Hamiltosporidium tvaerminnensis]TBU06011.1 histone H2A/H2B/H3/H4-like centromeric protein [Hamiltosporidium magnivora]TBU10195.1 histone H2A/H2B/H3/H4-like centromeric protein [Hamiltosporidium tvaerminnensis]
MARSVKSSKTIISPTKSTQTLRAARKKSLSVKTPIILAPEKKSITRRSRPQSHVLKEIKYYQETSNLLMSRLPFTRLVRQTLFNLKSKQQNIVTRFTKTAIHALQESFEAYVVSLFESAYSCTIHAKRVTLYPSDVRLARKLKTK